MKYLILAIIALLLNGCVPDTGDTIYDYSTTSNDNSIYNYEYFDNDGVLQICQTTESNNTTCEPYYDQNDEMLLFGESNETAEALGIFGTSSTTTSSQCPVGYAYCSIIQACNPVSSTGSVCTQ